MKPLEPDDYARAARTLARRDPVMKGLVGLHGLPPLGRRVRTHFESLARSIVHQQVSGSSAAATWRKLEALVGGKVAAEPVLRHADRLREAGLSGSKAASILDLAMHVDRGELSLAGLGRRHDDDILERLVQVRGIGPWTAHMFLLFQLRRPDVWPIGDYGVRKGWQNAYGGDMPSPAQLEDHGEGFRPIRSVAAWYLWRATEAVP
jgi:3-methyladenine DNA glycosylase/8-oxoguanine DNA glycosylase